MARGKKYRKAVDGLSPETRLSLNEAVEQALERKYAKFDETVELVVNLNVDRRHADQQVRGTVTLPHGTGKDVRVAVFVKGERLRDAEEAGADIVGAEDLAEKIEKGFLDFDAVVATPEMMRVVGKLGKVLGPRGLMPNPKLGTVTDNIGDAVRELKSGKVEYRVDRTGIVHVGVGKASFSKEQIVENAQTLLEALHRARPAAVKGRYMKSITLSTTMGPGIRVQWDAAA